MTPLLILLLGGALSAAIFARRLERLEPAGLAHAFLIVVTALMGVRVLAYVAANVFALKAVRPLSTGPSDLTNLVIGAFYGLALVPARDNRWSTFCAMPDVRLAFRVAAGMAFVLAGLANAFLPDLGVRFFEYAGYTRTFRLFIMTAEILGGAALLLPWRWLTLVAAAGLAVDMFGAMYTQLRVGEPVGSVAAALAMLLRLAPLAVLTLAGLRYRRLILVAGVSVCVMVAFVGAQLMLLWS